MRCTNNAAHCSDELGVMATADVKARQILFEDSTVVGSVSDPEGRCDCCQAVFTSTSTSIPCCDIKYCSTSCAEQALKSPPKYYKALCGKNVAQFSDIEKNGLISAGIAAYELLMLQLLAVANCITAKHPLKVPMIAWQSAAYDADYLFPVSSRMKIKRQMQMLQLLGINIFTDLQYDTWVLQTITARMNANQQLSPSICASKATPTALASTLESTGFLAPATIGREWPAAAHINPLSMFVNHSCSPNVVFRIDVFEASMTIKIVATRDIKKGEELFQRKISGESLRGSLNIRREAVKCWLAGDCQCDRCLKEETQQRGNGNAGAESAAPVLSADGRGNDEFHQAEAEPARSLWRGSV